MIGVFLIVLALSGCRNEIHVQHMTQPDYPLRARFANEQGTVNVSVHIGADGKVIFAKGSGAPEMLVKAAEENVSQWTFGPFPSVSEFPQDHTIQYVYKLTGKPLAVVLEPTIRTFLPDRVEISATPMVSDYPPIEDAKPAGKKK